MATPGKTKMLLKYKSVDKHVKLSSIHQCKQGNVTSSTSILFSSLVCTLPKKPTIPWLSHHYTLTALGCRDGAVGVQGWRSGESTCLPPMWPGSIPRSGVKCGLSLLVLFSAPRGFLQVLRFPLSPKTKI